MLSRLCLALVPLLSACALFGSSEAEVVALRATADGVWIEGRAVAEERLLEELVAALERRELRAVRLECPRDLPRARAEELMELIHRATSQVRVEGERRIETRYLDADG
jgi:hypothetical protein